MPDKPSAEIAIDEALVRRLITAQARDAIGDAADLPLRKVADGWDSEIWRLGVELAVRLPRRTLAAPLVLNEHRSLPLIGPAVEATGIRVPAPIVRGRPDDQYPWAWSVVPWIDGTRGIDIPRPQRAGWSAPLADALGALHVPAPEDHPVNPVRGLPLATRDAAFSERLSGLASSGAISRDEAGALRSRWREGLAAAAWDRSPVWIHGDLHPGNLIADGGTLTGIIDFGDVTAGDPAYDLAVAWLAFDRSGRHAFIAATAGRYNAPTWVRARAWAGAIAVMLLAHSDDNPDYAALGRESLAEVIASGSSR
jgi:aminoglycoside phosphotransferase (APT) family kinase protein